MPEHTYVNYNIAFPLWDENGDSIKNHYSIAFDANSQENNDNGVLTKEELLAEKEKIELLIERKKALIEDLKNSTEANTSDSNSYYNGALAIKAAIEITKALVSKHPVGAVGVAALDLGTSAYNFSKDFSKNSAVELVTTINLVKADALIDTLKETKWHKTLDGASNALTVGMLVKELSDKKTIHDNTINSIKSNSDNVIAFQEESLLRLQNQLNDINDNMKKIPISIEPRLSVDTGTFILERLDAVPKETSYIEIGNGDQILVDPVDFMDLSAYEMIVSKGFSTSFEQLNDKTLFGDDGTNILTLNSAYNGIEVIEYGDAFFVSNGVQEFAVLGYESIQFLDGTFSLTDFVSFWTEDTQSIQVAAATYQFFSGLIPVVEGFNYLIKSDINNADLNDPYYNQFNIENKYINFANNLGTAGSGKQEFIEAYGSLSFEETVRQAFEEIVGSQSILDKDGDPDDSIEFFIGAEQFYTDVANERVVSNDVSLDLAVKVVAIGSILNKAVKDGSGSYASGIQNFISDIEVTGTSDSFGLDLFA